MTAHCRKLSLKIYFPFGPKNVFDKYEKNVLFICYDNVSQNRVKNYTGFIDIRCTCMTINFSSMLFRLMTLLWHFIEVWFERKYNHTHLFYL